MTSPAIQLARVSKTELPALPPPLPPPHKKKERKWITTVTKEKYNQPDL